MGTPAAEVSIDEALVRRLLAAQHPDLAALAVEPADAGWDNATFRLGPDLAVRLPRRALAAALVEHEQRWLPHLAPDLPLAVPTPVRVGAPAAGYPWPWSVVPWLPGAPADLAKPAAAEARSLGAFLRALHRPAPPDAPANPYRGVPLARRADAFAERLDRLETAGVDLAPATAAWRRALAADPASEQVWVHGDLHARNVLVERERITGVIDWGDLTAGDPATDLAAAWLVFPTEAHAEFRQGYGTLDSATWDRARGWAAFFAVMLLDTGLADDPRFEAVGRSALARLDG